MPKENKTIGVFERHAKIYDKMQPLVVPRYNEILSVMADAFGHLVGRGDFLDLGCGTGNLSVSILKASPMSRTYLIDGSQAMAEIARRKIFKKFGDKNIIGHKTANLEDANWDAGIDKKFDAIVSTFALEHLRWTKYRRLLEKCRKHLKPGGVIIFLEWSDNDHKMKDWFYNDMLARGEAHKKYHGVIKDSAHNERHFFVNIMRKLGWIKKAGFKDVHTIWQYLFGYIVVGTK